MENVDKQVTDKIYTNFGWHAWDQVASNIPIKINLKSYIISCISGYPPKSLVP